MILNFLTKNSSQTKKIANFLTKEILNSQSKRKGALILGLVGDLGSGKTTFLQGFANGFGIKQRITSPTFVIMRRYKTPRSRTSSLRGRQNTKYKIQNLYHIDCYRVQGPKEILDLGFKEIASDSQNIVAIEWADKIKRILPQNMVWINFEFIKKRSFGISNRRFLMDKSKRKIILDVIK